MELTGDIYWDGNRQHCYSVVGVRANTPRAEFQFNDGERNRNKHPRYPLFEPRPPIVFEYDGDLHGIASGDGPYVTGIESWIRKVLRKNCPALSHVVRYMIRDLGRGANKVTVNEFLQSWADCE